MNRRPEVIGTAWRSPAIAAALLVAGAAIGACGVSDAPGGARRGGDSAAVAGPGPGAKEPDAAAHPGAADDHEAEVAELLAFEDRRRRETDFATLPAGDGQLGANPYQVRRLRRDRAVGALRGADAIVLLDGRGGELARAAAPPTPTALVVDRGRIWAGGTGSGEIALYRARGDRLKREASLELDGARTVRALAASPDGSWLYAADERTGLVAALAIERRGAGVRVREQRAIGRCREPIQLALAGRWLVVNCLAEHALIAHSLDARGRPTGAEPVRVVHDGPFWSVAAASAGGRTVVAAGGVEDHPLVRKAGGFGYIDSFLYLYELPAAGHAATRLGAVNLSEQGVVTPKWVALALEGGVAVRTAGYATDVLAALTWPALPEPGRPMAAPAIERRRFLPGSTDWSPGDAGAPALAASPLLDGWIVDDGGAPALQAAGDSPPRSIESRVGEALFFTTLMSPWSRSDGELSRFTCETCHFEAYGDGRVHFTGRGTVHASTKPLRGLFNNRPHFTRALDRSMAQMVHAEFRVANRWNGRDPWFALEAGDVPWLASVDGVPPSMSAPYLRRALMSFLMELTFEPNQAVRGRQRFSARERAGAELFRRRCESCHAARLVAEEPSTAVPFESWEGLVFSPQGPIVWASAEYQKTGVEPYPHPRGARTTSLRRAHHKFPYFTSGSARSLADVVARVGWIGDRFFHDGAPAREAERLQPDERASLLAFLELL